MTVDKLTTIFSHMLHRKIAAAWVSWQGHVQEHRYRNLSSAAQSTLKFVPPNKRSPQQMIQIQEWLCRLNLDCLRPLIKTYQHQKLTHGNGNDTKTPSTSALSGLCRTLQFRNLNRGEVLFWQTDIGEHYVIVVSGQIGIYADPERGAAARR